MFSNKKNIHNLFMFWLGTSLSLVFMIIIVGGLTRLTDSGLSITEWELVKGILPPLNQSSWNFYFDQYKKIPQFKLLNYEMSLEDFKTIFYWEYFHRMLARLIGLFFVIPLIYFYFSKKINKKYLNICYMILSLILLQGLIGWYMVKSGLTNNISVSHYRLSIHLTIAFIIISSMFWLFKNLKDNKNKSFFNFSKKNIPFLILILLMFSQIVCGAFVSGLDAGRIYQTWPFMGQSYIPNDLIINQFNDFFNFKNHSLVQFYHRNLAYVITIYILVLTINIYKNKIKNLFVPLKFLNFFLILQIIFGIFTLLSGLNIYIASAHQINSVLLVFAAINLYYFKAK